MKKLTNQSELNKFKIEDVMYEVENDDLIVEYYDNTLNSGGCAVFDLPNENVDIEEFIIKSMLIELKK